MGKDRNQPHDNDIDIVDLNKIQGNDIDNVGEETHSTNKEGK